MVKRNKVRIKNSTLVVGYKSGRMLEMSTCGTKKKTVKPLKNRRYAVVSTGEIKDYRNKSTNRTANPKSLKRTFKKIRRIVATNFGAGDLWLTLTYAQVKGKPIRDTKKVYNDFNLFKRKLKRRIGSFDYFRCT